MSASPLVHLRAVTIGEPSDPGIADLAIPPLPALDYPYQHYVWDHWIGNLDDRSGIGYASTTGSPQLRIGITLTDGRMYGLVVSSWLLVTDRRWADWPTANFDELAMVEFQGGSGPGGPGDDRHGRWLTYRWAPTDAIAPTARLYEGNVETLLDIPRATMEAILAGATVSIMDDGTLVCGDVLLCDLGGPIALRQVTARMWGGWQASAGAIWATAIYYGGSPYGYWAKILKSASSYKWVGGTLIEYSGPATEDPTMQPWAQGNEEPWEHHELNTDIHMAVPYQDLVWGGCRQTYWDPDLELWLCVPGGWEPAYFINGQTMLATPYKWDLAFSPHTYVLGFQGTQYDLSLYWPPGSGVAYTWSSNLVRSRRAQEALVAGGRVWTRPEPGEAWQQGALAPTGRVALLAEPTRDDAQVVAVSPQTVPADGGTLEAGVPYYAPPGAADLATVVPAPSDALWLPAGLGVLAGLNGRDLVVTWTQAGAVQATTLATLAAETKTPLVGPLVTGQVRVGVFDNGTYRQWTCDHPWGQWASTDSQALGANGAFSQACWWQGQDRSWLVAGRTITGTMRAWWQSHDQVAWQPTSLAVSASLAVRPYVCQLDDGRWEVGWLGPANAWVRYRAHDPFGTWASV